LIETVEEMKAFKSMLNSLTSIYSRPELDRETLRVWWMKLDDYDFNVVSKAFDSWVDKNKFMPTIFDIVALCKLSKPKEYIKMLPKNPTPYEILHNKEKAKELISKVVLKPTDPKAWAKRILERQAKGEYRFELGVKFAKEALRVK
jgi:hypothetical protein